METIHEMCMQGREEEEEEEEFSSKRIRISYNEPEELKLYRPLNTWTFFANNPIPFVIEHRSLHLHSLNVKVEDLISSFENKSVIPETVLIQFEKISAHLFQHVIKCRNSMPRKHKMLLWVIRSRIDLIKHSYSLHKSKDYGNIESLAYFEKLGLLISAKIVQDYTLKELWRSIRLLMEKFNVLKYHDSIRYYVDCLYLCCGKFFILTKTSKRIFDYSLFCEINQETGKYQINDEFIEETERVFYHFHMKLWATECFSWKSVPKLCLKNNHLKLQTLHTWFGGKIKQPFLEFIERDLRKEIFKWHLLIGENERFIKEEKFGDPTPYNIIAKWRPEHIDYCLEKLNGKEVVSSIVQNLIERGEEKVSEIVDLDLDKLCIIIINYLFDSIFTVNNQRFEERFIIEANDIVTKKFFNIDDFPLIVCIFNEYSVYYKDTLHGRSDFVNCFIEWVRIVAEDSKWKSTLPQEPADINLFFLYEMLFPEKTLIISKISTAIRQLTFQQDESDIILPDHYN